MSYDAIVIAFAAAAAIFFWISKNIKLNAAEGSITSALIPGLQTLLLILSLVMTDALLFLSIDIARANNYTNIQGMAETIFTIAMLFTGIIILFYAIAVIFRTIEVLFFKSITKSTPKD